MGLGIRSTIRRISRAIRKPDKRRIAEYLAGTGPKRLHIGCGDHPLSGWLNCDLLDGWMNEKMMRGEVDVINLDAIKSYPFADNTFDRIFSEHMIEHVSHEDGARMLAECYRVLKPSGRIRITTPDLAFLMRLYINGGDEVHRRYIEWSAASFPGVIAPEAPYVINNFVRDWGHKFIYDKHTLTRQFEDTGFCEIESCPLGESSHDDLRGLDREDRMPPGFLRLESLTIEATK
jgi:predicted SAM-dependent methyltransferase